MGLSFGHLIVILVIVLVIFGAGKLPQIMADMAKGMKAFKDGMKDEAPKKAIKSEISTPKPAVIKEAPKKATTKTETKPAAKKAPAKKAAATPKAKKAK